MKHEIKKISKIIDEITTCFMHHFRATRFELVMNRSDSAFELTFVFKGIEITPDALKKLRAQLIANRNPELENYYWQLTGELEDSNELALVCMMTDHIEIDYKDGNLFLKLRRKT
jgi:hypothetical protein